jgi:hypothetical protein
MPRRALPTCRRLFRAHTHHGSSPRRAPPTCRRLSRAQPHHGSSPRRALPLLAGSCFAPSLTTTAYALFTDDAYARNHPDISCPQLVSVLTSSAQLLLRAAFKSISRAPEATASMSFSFHSFSRFLACITFHLFYRRMLCNLVR